MNHFLMELKEIAETGIFRGIASVYGAEDLGGDVIDKGAFTKTLSENPMVPLLWQHRSSDVIGSISLKEWQGKIMGDGALDMEDPEVSGKIYGKMKRRMVKGLSIGFQAIKTAWVEESGKQIRHIAELKLWEVSVVTFPMLPSAQITNVKEHDDTLARLMRAEAEIEALKAKYGTHIEPPNAAEPPNAKGAEPVNHSRAMYLIESLRLGLAN